MKMPIGKIRTYLTTFSLPITLFPITPNSDKSFYPKCYSVPKYVTALFPTTWQKEIKKKSFSRL
jgi:hypothetical protein